MGANGHPAERKFPPTAVVMSLEINSNLRGMADRAAAPRRTWTREHKPTSTSIKRWQRNMKARFMPKKVHPMEGPCTSSEKGDPNQASSKSGSSRVNRYKHSDASVLRWHSKPSSNAPQAQSSLQSSTARTSPQSSRLSGTSEPHQTHEISSRRSKSTNVDKKIERRRSSNARRPTTEGLTESWHFSNWDDTAYRYSDSNSACSSQNSLYVDLDDFDDELELEPLEKKRKNLRTVLQADEESPFENSLRSLNISERNPLDMS
ncbi:hypothetical protein THAOC_10088, partial [Thalassiosira oceanica]